MQVKRDCDMEYNDTVFSGSNTTGRSAVPDGGICGDDILKSKYTHGFVGITVLVATSNDGYVYQFSNNGESPILYNKKKSV